MMNKANGTKIDMDTITTQGEGTVSSFHAQRAKEAQEANRTKRAESAKKSERREHNAQFMLGANDIESEISDDGEHVVIRIKTSNLYDINRLRAMIPNEKGNYQLLNSRVDLLEGIVLGLNCTVTKTEYDTMLQSYLSRHQRVLTGYQTKQIQLTNQLGACTDADTISKIVTQIQAIATQITEYKQANNLI